MKTLFLLLVLWQLAIPAMAQTATNFTANDCSGVSHDLFSELDAGKVVVICWVMPCASCTGPALTSYNVVTYYQTEYPGRVLFYMVDDYANTNCTSLDSWANSKGIPSNSYSFRFVNAAITMSDYGTDGMPKTIVVGGGSSHKVYLNENFTLDPDVLMNAIEQALIPTGIADPSAVDKAVIYPNPADDRITVALFSSKTEKNIVQVMDISGNIIQEISYEIVQGENKLPVNISSLSNGSYFVRLKESGNTISKFVINR